MADYFLQFSFLVFEDLQPAECAWLEERSSAEWWEVNDPEQFMGFGMEIQDNSLWINSEESGDVDQVAGLLHEFIRLFRPDDHVIFEWSWTCSKLRADGFSGGACYVSATETAWFNPEAMASQYAEKGECEPVVVDCRDAVQRLGDACKS